MKKDQHNHRPPMPSNIINSTQKNVSNNFQRSMLVSYNFYFPIHGELECLRCWENMISQFLQMIKQHVHWVVEQEKISKCLLEAVQDNCSSILGENRYMTS